MAQPPAPNLSRVAFRDVVSFVLVSIYLSAVMLLLIVTGRISPKLQPARRVRQVLSWLARPFRGKASAGNG